MAINEAERNSTAADVSAVYQINRVSERLNWEIMENGNVPLVLVR
jgi:hypothetical protein